MAYRPQDAQRDLGKDIVTDRKARVLVVEDQVLMRRLLIENLSPVFEVTSVGTLSAAAAEMARDRFDLVLLDVTLPDGDGVEFCTRVRLHSNVPIIIVTARAEVAHVVAGLEAGADDYISKPFRFEELAARIGAQLRRSTTLNEAEAPERIEIGDLVVDDALQDAVVRKRRAGLTQTEFAILRFLGMRAGKAVSRAAIFNHVWGSRAEHTEKILSVYVRRIRQKIEVDSIVVDNLLERMNNGTMAVPDSLRVD